jgi:Uma2 family endonuclease
MVATDRAKVSEAAYRRVALRDPDGQWELHRGQLREKPAMTVRHNDRTFLLGHLLQLQLPRDAFRIRVNSTRLRRSDDTYYIPDVVVVPTALSGTVDDRPGVLEAYDLPLPLVVEVWSPSTGDYDVSTKVPEYQARGDLEIWRLHPYERSLTSWTRRSDGTYLETTFRENDVVRPVALPDIALDLAVVFED